MIVVDVNIIAYLLLAGEKTKLAQELYQLDSDWRVPELWSHEFLNVLASNVKFSGISLAQANMAWENGRYLLSDNIQSIDHKLALSLAVEHQISAYDAQYVALAQSLGCLLLTEDAKLCDKLPETAVRMANFLASQETN
jgi:predicted nucleic acid-binding protein